MEPIVEIVDLRVAFDGLPVLHGVDLSIRRGESVGMVGESGCGKSVTWLAALGLLPQRARTAGSVRLAGEELLRAPASCLDKVRGGRIAMIFQDPASALNPVHKVGDQIAEVLRLHRGLERHAAKAEARRLFDQVGIPDAARRLDAYPHEFSGGQNQRIMIAMALAGRPDVLIADEPTTALDVTIQAQILELLQQIQRETGMALVLISHDLGIVGEVCERVLVFYAGRIVEEAPVDRLFAHPSHPYTRGLIGALPSLERPQRRLSAIPGVVPSAADLPSGCAFAARCELRVERCAQWAVELSSVSVDCGHKAA
ncbi:ABC transporter ATP-binding protein [Bradyrhizobium sp. LMTR 3]|uniref:ABC transporter ATP-binding protein n=1 Tax=Bradyrhizobium sp. LMTR 3 TaxID=189873 RepID=UPI000810ED35|nr:ABC transporter ATP-binding protein [Bradyrhizobium sp. LMTR 3]OCK60063.1 oligopeptide transporter ATP-binding component [Bradyrhizobium sp. LMTR 3]